jgi:hypothetical protein
LRRVWSATRRRYEVNEGRGRYRRTEHIVDAAFIAIGRIACGGKVAGIVLGVLDLGPGVRSEAWGGQEEKDLFDKGAVAGGADGIRDLQG